MNSQTKWAVVRIAITFLYLLAGWVLFTGSIDLHDLAMGGAFSLMVAILTYDSFIVETEAAWRSHLPRPLWAIAYLLVLLWEMYRSSFALSWMILTGRYKPRVVHFRTRLRTDIARAAVATAVTVTPGTVTLEMNDDHLIVHWIHATTSHNRRAGEIIKGRLESVLRRVWS